MRYLFKSVNCVILIFAFTLMPLCCFTQRQNTGTLKCDLIPIQNQLDIKKLMGDWFVVEITEHYTPRKPYTDTCIKVELKPIDKYQHINLIWRESDYSVTYTFDSTNQSYWLSQGHQIQKPEQLKYQHFAGTVSVVKAVQDNIVLTFCSPNSVFYSLILSKTSTLRQSELDINHRMFERHGMPISERRKYCKNSAITNFSNYYLSIILSCIIMFLIR